MAGKKLSVDLTMNSQGFKQGSNEVIAQTNKLTSSTRDYIATAGSLRKQFLEARREAQNLAAQYNDLSKAEKQSEIGKEIRENMQFAIQRAGELQDVMSDTQQAIRNTASDTRGFDAWKQGFDAIGDAALSTVGAITYFTGESEDLTRALGAWMAIEKGISAVTKIQNALQKQSAIMLGIQRLQTAALTQAQIAQKSATVGATIAQKAFNMVANANPYVLLATAILAVGSALLIFTGRSKEAETQEQRFEKSFEKTHVSLSNYSSDIGEHALKLSMLKDKVHDNTLSLDERKKAINDIRAIVPDYTASISNEGEVYNENTSALDKYIDKLFQYYRALAWKDKYIEQFKKGIDAQEELEKATEKTKQAQEGLDKMNQNYDNSFFASGPGATAGGSWMGSGQDIAMHSTVANLSKAQKAQEEAKKKLDEINKETADIEKKAKQAQADVGDFNPDGPKSGSKGGGKSGNGAKEITTKPLEIPVEVKPIIDYMSGYKGSSIKGLQAQIQYFQKVFYEATDTETRAYAYKKKEELEKDLQSLLDLSSGKINIKLPKLEFNNDNDKAWYNVRKEFKGKYQEQADALFDSFQEGEMDETTFETQIEGLKNLQEAVDDINADGLNKIGDGFSSLGSAIGQFGGDSAKAAGQVLGATGQLFAAIGQVLAIGGSKALADALSKPFPANIGAIGTVIGLIATMVAQVASLSSMKFATGGIVPGGSYSGDKVLAYLNSGEGVLTRQGVANLNKLYNNINSPTIISGTQKVEFVIKGKNLVGTMGNYEKQQNKII